MDRLAKLPGDKTRLYCDGGGLYLCVDKRGGVGPDGQRRAGSASWMFRYMIDGNARTMGLGAYPTVGLAKARRKATEAREALSDGHDPLDLRNAARASKQLARATAMTFREAAEVYIASKQDEWKNAKHAEQWPSTLKAYAYPIIGDVSIADIDNAAVLRVLQQDVTATDGKSTERLWTAKPETASRLRGRLEAVLGWAIAGGRRTAENCARWDILKHQLPAKTKLPRGRVKHHAALPIDAMPEFMPRLREAEGMGARALEFAILTAARSGEVRGARWAEIDLKAKVWNVPGSRMKAGRDHRVPLSSAAVTLLQTLPRGEANDLVFLAPKGGMLSDTTLSAVLRRMKVDAVPHGIARSTFRDWGSERTNFPSEMLEMALAHTVSNKVEAAYRRGDLFEKRRALMDAWAAFIASPVSNSNVTDLAIARGLP
ncbi:integrase arm-type DNA-binding domain-containing protein [Sphingomonas sp. RB56-2]|uniref:Integrase arm-type DNA-binding domain-containing protein n=1 Tax=Sphingomonas brevis TaxID=2908206 RepID=A0ABT0SBJ6_9SPHN|nr:integrase arm-type DNA-binding domain-containing protein [Sphingomonas brevis]